MRGQPVFLPPSRRVSGLPQYCVSYFGPLKRTERARSIEKTQQTTAGRTSSLSSHSHVRTRREPAAVDAGNAARGLVPSCAFLALAPMRAENQTFLTSIVTTTCVPKSTE
eukprot:6466329-Amphidinium_carterae.1